MDKIPTTTFTWSPDTEVDRIFVTARSIYNGFYTGNKFVILPYLDEPGDTSRVVLPELKYSKIDNFWRKVGKLERQVPMSPPKRLFEELKTLYEQKGIEKINQKTINKRKNTWQKLQNEYWQFITELFPDNVKRIKEVEVRLTNYGTISSMSNLPKSDPHKAYIYLRKDANISHLASIIIKVLLLESLSQKYSWRERMGIADFLMTNSKLKDIFPAHQHIVMALDNVKENNFAKSKKYLNKLNVKYEVKPLEVLDKKIYSSGKIVDAQFTAREKRILKEMLRKKRLIDFDEVADLLWQDPEDYSLWAMNKAMQRLRDKLVDLGLPEEALVTKRKQGYFLDL